MMRRKDRFVRMVLTVGYCLFGLDLLAGNVFLKYGGKGGHWSDPTIWMGDTPPGNGDTARLYQNNDTGGQKIIVETEEDWAAFAKVGEAVLYYGAQLTLHTDTDRTITQTMGGGVNGTGSKIFKTGTGKLTMATQNFKGITVVSNGWMTMGPTSYENAGVYEVAEGATLEVYPNANTHLLGLRGAGTVTGSGGKQLAFCASMYKGHDVEVMPPYHFSGTLTGKIDLTAGRQEAAQCRAEGQYFDNVDTSDLTSAIRLYNGIFNVKAVGTKTASDPSSIGTQNLNYFGTYDNEGDTLGLRYTGEAGEVTDKALSISYYANKPGRFPTFDGGPNGGVTFQERWSFYSTLTENDATCFILDGSNTAKACVIDCEIVERYDGNSGNPSASGQAFLKRGPGVWRMTSRNTHGNRGPILVERGRLEYESLAEAGAGCSLGLMTFWSTNFWLKADCPSVGFAYLLGDGDNTVSPETATMAYVGGSAASCSTRPLALKGAGRFANDSEYSMAYAGATAAEAGKDATLVLAGSNGGTFTAVTNGAGRLSVVKEGAGTWNLADGVDLAAVMAKEGTLSIGMNYQFYRWKVTANNGGDGGTWMVAFDGFAVMDADGNMLNGSLGKSGVSLAKTGHPERLEPGEICYSDSKFTVTANVNRPIDSSFDWDPEKGKFRKTDANIEFTPKKDDPTTHPVVYFRTDPGVQVAKYDVMGSGQGARNAVCWELAGSVDGRTWDPLHTRETNSLTGYVELTSGKWHSTGTTTRGGWEIPCGKVGATFDIGSVGVAGGGTVSFIGNAAGTVVSNLVLSADGGGTITGATIAASGTIDVTDFERTDFDTEIPLDLTGCTGSANVADWTLKINGKPAKNAFRVTTTGVTVLKSGTVLIVR